MSRSDYEAMIHDMARAYWQHLTPDAGRSGTSYETDEWAGQYRDAARTMYATLPLGHVVSRPGEASP